MKKEHWKIICILLFVMVAVPLAACSKPTVDASSEEAIKTSVAEVRKSLPEAKRAEFDEAVGVVAMSGMDMKDLFTAGATGGGTMQAKMNDALHGKTGEQILAAADKILMEREAKQKEQAVQEIKELEEKRESALQAREQLEKFEVLKSRFYIDNNEFIGKRPVIELTVKNNTGAPVSRAYFTGTVASPGRAVPWHQDEFNYQISGGIETGEEASWSLSPNMFSGWGSVEAPDDAIFTVTVERLDGADGEPLYSAKGFGERQEKRLAELKKKYPNQ